MDELTPPHWSAPSPDQAALAERRAIVAMLERKAKHLRFKGRRVEAAILEEEIYNIASGAHTKEQTDEG